MKSDRSSSLEIPRRDFLLISGGTLVLPLAGCVAGGAPSPRLRLGLIADLHHGLDPRAQERVEDFIGTAQRRRADMIVQLGDFNFADRNNRPCLDAWEQFRGERHHVLGNHDMDKFAKPHVLDYWQMPARYYSFDRGGYHFVILDRNHVKQGHEYLPYAKGNYFRARGVRGHADAEQLEWLAADLRETTKPTVVFVHQGVGMWNKPYPAEDGREPIETVLRRANRDAADGGKASRVIACFCGHEHLDRHNLKDGIHYVWINSASYYWVGGKYGRMAPYADALYAFVDLEDDCIVIHGKQSSFVSPTPRERGFPRWNEITACQVDRRLVARGRG